MTDYKNHGGAPIEFCGDQEGWIAVGSLTSDSPNSPCFPRSVLLGVGLGPSGKMHPSNIAAMLTIEQATDLRARLTEAMAVDRPAPTPTPAPGLDLDAVADTMRGLDNIFAQAMSSRDAEIARLTAELAAARAVPADVEAAIEELRRAEEVDARAMTGQSLAARVLAEATLRTAIARAISDATAARGTVGGLLATEPVGSIVEFVSPDGMYHQAVVAGGRLLSRRWQHALSHSPGDWTLYAFWLDGAYLRLPARLVPAAEADADPSQRGPLPKGG